MSKKPLTDFAAQAGISIGYASDIINGKRAPSLKMALRIHDRTRRAFGPLAGMSAQQIASAKRMFGERL